MRPIRRVLTGWHWMAVRVSAMAGLGIGAMKRMMIRLGSARSAALRGLVVFACAALLWGTWGTLRGMAQEGGGEPEEWIEEDWVLYWETYDQPGDNQPIDNHPAVPANGGKRIFPGKKTDDDAYADERRLVFAVVEFTEEPEPGTKMWFRLWDVDDPSAASAPIDDAGSPDKGTNGPDNRDSSWEMAGADGSKMVLVELGKIKRFPGDGGPTTCDSKICKVAVRVGMQPGDNWRFCAAREEDENALRGMTQDQADRVRPPRGVNESKMLTTWRKLHVEIDSMPTEPNSWPDKDPDCKAPIVDSVTVDSPVVGDSVIKTYGAIGSPEEDHYEGGRIWKTTGTRWGIKKNTANLVFGDDIRVAGVLTQEDIDHLVGQVCSLCDDDSAAYPQLPVFPGTGPVMTSRLAMAYVLPVLVEAGENTNPIVPRCYVNMDYYDWLFGDWTARDLIAAQRDYWTAYVVMAYQGPASNDGDPDGNPDFGQPDPVYEASMYGGKCGYSAAVFVEVSRDAQTVHSSFPSMWPSIDEIMTHEAGHLGGAVDSENPNDIMDPSTGMKKPGWFLESEILKFRREPFWKPIGG